MDADAAEELRAHLELLTGRYVESGMTPGAARAAAARQMGNVTRVREDLHEMNGFRVIDNFARDVRFAMRQVGSNRVFALVVVITMALGIGANTAILSVAYSVLLKPLPYVNAEEIHSVSIIVPERREQIPSLPATVQVFLAWQRGSKVFPAITALTPWDANVTGDGEPESLGGAEVATNFFTFLGVPPARGRGFTADEAVPGKDRVVVISDALWRRRYGADDAIVGKSITLSGEPYQIVGVAPPSFLVPTRAQLNALIPFAPRIDIWKPIAPTPATLNNESWDHAVLVRMANPADRERGQRELAVILNDLVREHMPGVKSDPIIELVSVRDVYSAKVRRAMLLVVAAAALLLVTACASIANVFLARGASRATEIALRLALGAGRGRIAAQMVTESLVLAVFGGGLGVVFASMGTRLLAEWGPDDIRALSTTAVDLPFLMSAIALIVLTGVACGVIPVLQANRREPADDLKDAARHTPRRAALARQVLVGVEMALATVLLSAGALLVHSFLNVMNTDRGYAIDGLLTAELSLAGQRYQSGDAQRAFYDDLLHRVRALPAVVAAGAINNLPAVSAADGPSRTILRSEDTDFASVLLLRPVALIRSVTPGYFAASGTTLLAGRLFNDVEPQLAAIISESLAARLWPGAPAAAAIGKELRQGGNMSSRLVGVVGVVADAKPGGLDRDPIAAIYRPFAQWPSASMTIVARTENDPAASAGAIKAEIRSLDPDLPINAMRTMREVVSSTVSQRRFQTTLMLLFAIVALLLGIVGVYGVTNYAVGSRTRDIGVRLALGADRWTVMRWAFAIGFRPVLLGLAAGVVAALISANAIRAALFGITSFDPISLAFVTAILLTTASAACYFPARRAAAIDPVTALRHD
jgi:predicted permease